MEAIGMVFWAIAFAVCGFVVGCAYMAVKEKLTETEIEYNTKDIGDEKVIDWDYYPYKNSSENE